jgi:hypothetical protein
MPSLHIPKKFMTTWHCCATGAPSGTAGSPRSAIVALQSAASMGTLGSENGVFEDLSYQTM